MDSHNSEKKMEGLNIFVEDIVEMRDAIKHLRACDKDRSEENSKLMKEIATLKDENSSLVNQVKILTDKVSDLESDASATKKIMQKLNSKVAEIGDTPSDKGIKKDILLLKRNAETVTCLQKALNRMHLNLQDRKEMEEEVKSMKCEIQDLKNACHPSPPQANSSSQRQQASPPVMATPATATPTTSLPGSSRAVIRSSEMAQRKEAREKIKEKSKFDVRMTKPFPLQAGVTVMVDGYDDVYTASEFMDAGKGVYTTPVKGEYEFRVDVKEEGEKNTWFLCRSKKRKREQLRDWKKRTKVGYVYVELTRNFEADENVWIEVEGGTHSLKTWVEFYGVYLS